MPTADASDDEQRRGDETLNNTLSPLSNNDDDDLDDTSVPAAGVDDDDHLLHREEEEDNVLDGLMDDLDLIVSHMVAYDQKKRYSALQDRLEGRQRKREFLTDYSSSDEEDERFIVNESDVLGTGGFGVVYRGFDTHRGCYCAVKAALVGPDRAASIKLEFDVITQLTHPNVVRVLHFDITADNVARLFMEWVPGGSISSIQSRGVACVGDRATTTSAPSRKTNKRRLHEITLRKYAYDALLGLRYLHAQNVVHRDVKPANMLVSANGSVKLADLGVASLVLDASTSATGQLAGTLPYMAPECIRDGRYSAASDMWAWACSVVEMASGRPPWSHLPQLQQRVPLLFHIGVARPPDHHPPIPTHLSATLRTILAACFNYDPHLRPTANQLVRECSYFSMIADFSRAFAEMEPIRGFNRISIRSGVPQRVIRDSVHNESDAALTPDVEGNDESGEDPFSSHQESLLDVAYTVHQPLDDNSEEYNVTEMLGGPMSSNLLLLSDIS